MIYQVYPRSFADSDGDGIGDLRGIISRLDHLKGAPGALDVDAIWLSPIFPSPLADFGYDVSDYTDVDPVFGSLHDLDELVTACHARGLRVLLDLVACHTSDRHPWFLESRSSRTSPRRDWYIWADPTPDGGPPNNWTAVFGGSAWKLDEATDQYFLHSFYPEQPDINWRNPAVAEAMHDAMRFWLARGVDGFRVDAIQRAIKDDRLRDNPPPGPPDPWFPEGDPDFATQEHLWDGDRPEVHDVVRGLRRVADEYGALLVGEVYAPVDRLAGYLGAGRADEFQLAFDFELLQSPWDARVMSLAVERAEAYHPTDSWPTYALSNHDQRRTATRYGPERARLAAFLLLTLRATAFVYAGEEIGMRDATRPLPRHDRAGRDAQRTPMQWDPTPLGGFTTGDPWLPLTDPEQTNVAAQRDDPASLLAFYRALIGARRTSAALRAGSHRSIFGLPEGVIAFVRETDEERVVVALNLGDEPRTLDLARWGERGVPLIGTDGSVVAPVGLARLELAGLEGVAVLVDG